jgi:hypothetical protein
MTAAAHSDNKTDQPPGQPGAIPAARQHPATPPRKRQQPRDGPLTPRRRLAHHLTACRAPDFNVTQHRIGGSGLSRRGEVAAALTYDRQLQAGCAHHTVPVEAPAAAE